MNANYSETGIILLRFIPVLFFATCTYARTAGSAIARPGGEHPAF